jgi:rubrerythrin
MCKTHRRHFIAGSLTALGVLATIKTMHAVAADDAAPAKQWICPPCGCDADGKVFSAPGRCPACDMELIEKPADAPAAAAPDKR